MKSLLEQLPLPQPLYTQTVVQSTTHRREECAFIDLHLHPVTALLYLNNGIKRASRRSVSSQRRFLFRHTEKHLEMLTKGTSSVRN